MTTTEDNIYNVLNWFDMNGMHVENDYNGEKKHFSSIDDILIITINGYNLKFTQHYNHFSKTYCNFKLIYSKGIIMGYENVIKELSSKILTS